MSTLYNNNNDNIVVDKGLDMVMGHHYLILCTRGQTSAEKIVGAVNADLTI